jgi:hypothetical protein
MAMRPLKSSDPALPISATPVVVKPKACISCRTHKVKCNKSSPCTNCTLWSFECVYPSPIRRCPRPRKSPIAYPPDEGGGTDISPSLDERIQKVEKILKDLTSSISGHSGSPSETHELSETSDLRHCDNSQPIHWLAQHVSYVMISEMWIKLYNDEWLSNNASSGIHVTRNQILLTAIDIVDTPRRLEAEPQAKRWKWLLTAYLQYHPLAFLLNELCHSQQSDTLERAWAVTEDAFKRWTDDNKTSKNGEFLLEMLAKAKAVRAQTSERQPLQTSLLSQEPSGSLADMTLAMADATYQGVEQMTDLAPFFQRESQFGHSPMPESISDDMSSLGYMTYIPNFIPEQYNGFNWTSNRSHLEVLDDNSEDIMLGSEYQF